jgi:hypothetical protein
VQLNQKLLSWLLRKAMANRHHSKPELRSITPNIFVPSDETAFSFRTTPIWLKQRALDRLLHHHGNVGNRFVGGCGRRRCYPGRFLRVSFEP